MIAISYGGGTDSTGLCLAAYERKIRPDLIVVADTGSERPEFYTFLDVFDAWLQKVGWPRLMVVRWVRADGTFLPLHEWCERMGQLPSAAYGMAGCTTKWKQQPVDKAIVAHPGVQACHAAGEPVERWVGYDANEGRRAAALARKPDANLWRWRAPLIEWNLDRAACRALIARHGLPQPGKSACWLCPHASAAEVRRLAQSHPDLLARALSIEKGAAGYNREMKGLGRRWSWADAVAQPDLPFVQLEPDMPCGCHQRRRGGPRLGPYRPRAARLDPYRALLGLVSDAELARRAGVAVSTVAKMRARSEGRSWRSL